MEPRALIYGTIAIDTLITPRGQVSSVLGGSGPYAALAARLITPQAELVGVVGEDFPAAYTAAMEARGVSMAQVARVPGRTFAWTGRYEDDMNRRSTVETVEGVQEHWQMQLSEEQRRCAIACACNVTPRLQLAMLRQCTAAHFRMADFMESWILRERPQVDTILSMVDMALMNDSEVRAYTGCEDVLVAGERLLAAGPRYAVVKHGSAGATLLQRCANGERRLFRCPAWPLAPAQDPTGAGDAFMGALAGCLCACLNGGSPRWEDLKSAMAVATVVAGAVCEHFGTIGLFSLSRAELERRLARFHDMTCW